MGESEAIVKRKNKVTVFLIIYVILFFAAQAAYTYFYSHTVLRNMYLLQAIIRFAIWTVPVFIYLLLVKRNPFEYLKLNKNILIGIMWGLIIGSIIILFNILSIYFLRGTVNFKFSISGLNWFQGIITIISVAFQPFFVLLVFSEEVLFRGFILHKVEEISGFWSGNLANGVLFAAIHIVGWTIQGKSITSALGVFIFAVITGIVVKKTNSLWACVLIHICNNFIATTIIL